jgi:hypothetical protein
MKRLRYYLATFAALLTLAAVAVPAPAYAWSPFGDACPSGGAGSGSTVCGTEGSNTDNTIAGSNGLIMKIVNVIALVGGIAAVIIIIIAGLRFVTSGGSSDAVAGARRALIYSVVGLVILVLARTLVAFILGKL